MPQTLARRVIPLFVVSCGFLLASDPRAQTSVAAPPSQTIQAGAEELIAEKPPACPALDDEDVASRDGRKVEGMSTEELERLVITLEEEMFAAAEELRFEYAAKLRDEIKDLRRELQAAAETAA